MDSDEYLRLYRRLDANQLARFQAGVEKLKAELAEERRKDVEALNRTWALANDDTPPPDVSALASERVPVTAPQVARNNGSHAPTPALHTRNHRIRHAARQVEGDVVTQPLVMAKLRELFPEDAKNLDGTVISKNLRKMEDDGELETIAEAARDGSSPRVFRKMQAMSR